jgi:uncharacterized protein (UPF0262 family)
MMTSIASLEITDSPTRAHRFSKDARERTVTDLLNHGVFEIDSMMPPLAIALKIEHRKIYIGATSVKDESVEVVLSLHPLQRIFKDYAIVCETYHEAISTADPRKVEALDMGRRGLHNEGADAIIDQLEPHVRMDFETARLFFTLFSQM